VYKIFISYAHEDRPAVGPLAEGLERAGFDVWWDKELGAGDVFRRTIEERLRTSDVVVVVWSKRSVLSPWAADEANMGLDRGVLLPIRIDSTLPPLGFREFNVLDFSAWGNDFGSDEWRTFLSEVNRIAGKPAAIENRPEIRMLPQVLSVAGGWGAVIGGLTWSIQAAGDPLEVKTNVLGHPAVDALVFSFAACLPISFWSGIEVKRDGFESASLVLRRSLHWFVKGAFVALVVLVAATVAGVVRQGPPREVAGYLVLMFILVTTATASALTAGKLVWSIARRALGLRTRY